MSWVRSFTYRLLSLIKRSQIDEELEEELRFCFEKEDVSNSNH